MMKLLSLLVAVAAQFIFSLDVLAQDKVKIQLSEMIAQWEKYEEILSNTKGTKKFERSQKRSFQGTEVEFKERLVFDWLSHGRVGCVFLSEREKSIIGPEDVVRQLLREAPPGVSPEFFIKNVMAFNRDYSFELDYLKSQNRWGVKDIKRSSKGVSQSGILEFINEAGFYCNTPVGLYNITLRELFSDPTVEIQSISKKHEFLRVEFERPSPNLKGEIITDPTNYFVIVDSHISEKSPKDSSEKFHTKTYDYNFGEKAPRYPIKERTTSWTNSEKTAVEYISTFAIETVRSQPPSSEFRLVKFGLPDFSADTSVNLTNYAAPILISLIAVVVFSLRRFGFKNSSQPVAKRG